MSYRMSEYRQIQGRQDRGELLALRGHVTQVSKRRFLVASQSTPGESYTVRTKGEPSCTCPDYVQREARCKHIRAVFATGACAPKAVTVTDLAIAYNHLCSMRVENPAKARKQAKKLAKKLFRYTADHISSQFSSIGYGLIDILTEGK